MKTFKQKYYYQIIFSPDETQYYAEIFDRNGKEIEKTKLYPSEEKLENYILGKYHAKEVILGD